MSCQVSPLSAKHWYFSSFDSPYSGNSHGLKVPLKLLVTPITFFLRMTRRYGKILKRFLNH